MKSKQLTSILLLMLFSAACVIQKPMRVAVSGPKASSFTAKYTFGLFSGTITTESSTNPGALLEFPSRDGFVEITKAQIEDEVTLEVFEGKERTLSVISKPGEKGLRAVRRAGGWSKETL